VIAADPREPGKAELEPRVRPSSKPALDLPPPSRHGGWLPRLARRARAAPTTAVHEAGNGGITLLQHQRAQRRPQRLMEGTLAHSSALTVDD